MMSTSSDISVHLRIGSRGSALALAQVDLVAARLQHLHPSSTTETVIVTTQGDIDKISPLTEIGGRGVFTNALERELAHGQIDAALHSAKDLPSQVSPELPIVAFPEREDPRDVLVSRHGTSLMDLPPQPVIGTSSRRREAQIRQLRPDAVIVSLRGNIDTRLRKARHNDYDAIVLAAAGLARMGWSDQITEYFPIDVLVPAPGQGALAVQATAHSELRDVLVSLDDAIVSKAVEAERAFLAAIGAGCTMPVGAHVQHDRDGLVLYAFMASDAGDCVSRRRVLLDANEAAEHAATVAREMQSDVGTLDRTHWSGGMQSRNDLTGLRVAVTRPRRQAQQTVDALAERGAIPLGLPTIRIEPPDDRVPLERALRDLAAGAFTWVVFTSANAVDAVANTASELGARDECLRAIRAAAVGDATARAARDLGLDVAVVAEQPTAEGLVDALLPRVQAGERVLYPRSSIGRDVLPTALAGSGINITVVDAYSTVPEPQVAPDVLAQLRRGEVDAIFFSSPSAVSSLIAMLSHESRLIESIPAICAGPVTAAAVREAGLPVAAVSLHPGAAAMVEALADYWSHRAGPESDIETFSTPSQVDERVTGR